MQGQFHWRRQDIAKAAKQLVIFDAKVLKARKVKQLVIYDAKVSKADIDTLVLK